ncbi:hypothetical protein [Streptomyces albus]|uniref:hypothetical protein n=1 Tax=Streptomyces albus TaxID=1888 RepID=UPI001A9B5AB4|nr:hypothetical protein [Streptomyces albus]
MAGVMAGVVIGAGGMVWHSGEMPFRDERRADACWGAFSQQEMSRLVPDVEGRPRAAEIPAAEGLAAESPVGRCYLGRGYIGHAATVRLESLSEGWGDDGTAGPLWEKENLTAEMTSFESGRGKHISTGMASPTRAWREIPEACLPGGRYGTTPAVVVLTRAHGVRRSQNDEPAQREMARAVTDAANAIMRHHGCKGSLPKPGKLPRPPQHRDIGKRDLCDVDNLGWPRGMKSQALYDRVSKGSRHGVRICQFNPVQSADHDPGHFTTIVNPRLARAYDKAALSNDGPHIPTNGPDKTFGTLSTTHAVLQLPCRGDVVVFTAKPPNTVGGGRDGRQAMRKLFPRYVRAEAKRLGCKGITLKMPHYTD